MYSRRLQTLSFVSVFVLAGKIKDRNWKLWRFLATSGCLVELPLQFLHRKTADRAAWTLSSLHVGGLEWGGVHSVIPMGQHYSGLPLPHRGPGMRLPIPGAGGCCRPVITDDIHEVLFQIGFPVLPAASGANSTGRITQVAARLRECGLYKHSTNKKVKRHIALLLRASERGKWGYVLREGPTFLNTPTDSTITCQSN